MASRDSIYNDVLPECAVHPIRCSVKLNRTLLNLCNWFSPCDATRCTVFVILILSVYLSVCMSVRLSVCHTRGLCPHGSTYDHDFFTIWDINVHPKIRRGSHPARALNENGVGRNGRFLTNKPPYLRNGARYDKDYYWSLIGNRIPAFYWYQNQRPWLTLKWPWTAIMHYVALHTCGWLRNTCV